MKIGILGAGAIGSIYAGYLCSCHEVYMVDINQQHVDAINKNGLEIMHKGIATTYYPRATSNAEEVGICDLVIFLVKTYQSSDALDYANALFGPDTLILTLQNGLGNHYELIMRYPEENILIGTCAQGGSMLAPGQIKHVGAGDTEIGSISSNKSAEIAVFDAFSQAGIPNLTISDNIFQTVWKKLIRNAGINAITAIVGDTTNIVIRNSHANKLCKLVVKESVEIANLCGCKIDYEEMLAVLLKGAERNGLNRTSTLQDIEHGRPTEILSINGAIVEEAKRLGVPAPYNQCLTELVLCIENNEIKQI